MREAVTVLNMPALETAIIQVTQIWQTEVGDKLRTTIEGTRLGCPATTVQVSTFSDWRAALCQRARETGRPLMVSWRNYGGGDRRLTLSEWAH